MKDKYKDISDFLMKTNTRDLANANVVITLLMVLSHLESENEDSIILRRIRDEFERLNNILSWDVNDKEVDKACDEDDEDESQFLQSYKNIETYISTEQLIHPENKRVNVLMDALMYITADVSLRSITPKAKLRRVCAILSELNTKLTTPDKTGK